MGYNTLSRSLYDAVHATATQGGTTRATRAAEQRLEQGRGLDPLVDPKGLSHLGPVREARPRFTEVNGLQVLTHGLPMAEETLLDTTASMGTNVDLAFEVLPEHYDLLKSGENPILGRYDLHMATSIFNDVDDLRQNPNTAVLARSQFEQDQEIARQMAMLTPGRNGCGNGKEDSQFGLFAAAYLTVAHINRWGLKYYHFTVSDEPTVEYIDPSWLKGLFGSNVLEQAAKFGYELSWDNLPDTAQTVKDLQTRAHAFFLQVPGYENVTSQWSRLYGPEHVVLLPEGTRYLHFVKAVIIGLTEGVLDLVTAEEFLCSHGVSARDAQRIIRAVSRIPLGAQMEAPNFYAIPMAGDVFRTKLDMVPLSQEEAAALQYPDPSSDTRPIKGPVWQL